MKGLIDANPVRAAVPAAIGLGVLLLLLPACNSTLNGANSMEDRPGASAVRDPVLQDIPKPAGFQLAADRSMVENIGRVRLARCEYEGVGAASRVKRFYEEYLPAAGFDLRHWSLDRGEYSLDFESTDEECQVRIRPASRGRTIVTVSVRPKAQGSTQRDSQPPLRRPD